MRPLKSTLDVMMENIDFRFDKELPEDQVIALYTSLGWSSAEKPKELLKALANSHSVISAWDGKKLIGLANSISDGYLVVYYPHLLVKPEYQGRGIGKALVSKMKNKYCDFHQQIIVADGSAINFYKSCGFIKAVHVSPFGFMTVTTMIKSSSNHSLQRSARTVRPLRQALGWLPNLILT
jgi:GNAT superfamily N-acetyltransferase